MRLDGKSALITGAARGIGYAIAEAFAREGARVALADLDGAGAESAAVALGKAHGREAIGLRADVAKVEDNRRIVTSAIERLGQIDILVCNAGIVRKGRPIEEITPEQWQAVIDVNLLSCVYATQAFVPHAKARRSGRIIYMGSVAGQMGGVSAEIPYSVAKAGVLCLAKSMAKQLAAFGVTVNAIAPGPIETAMTDVLQYDESMKRSIPLQRYGAVADIAAAAVYLASEDAGYVTGATIDVNGGLYMR